VYLTLDWKTEYINKIIGGSLHSFKNPHLTGVCPKIWASSEKLPLFQELNLIASQVLMESERSLIS